MDQKQIVIAITHSTFRLCSDTKESPVMVIDLKASVQSLKYQLFGENGDYVCGSYQTSVNYERVSQNSNRLILNVRPDERQRTYMLRFYEVDVITDLASGSSQEIRVDEPIYYFYHFPAQVDVMPVDSHVVTMIDEVEPVVEPDAKMEIHV